MEAEIGIIGGSGFYSLLENAESAEIETEYGKPSDKVSVGTLGGRKVAFIACFDRTEDGKGLFC